MAMAALLPLWGVAMMIAMMVATMLMMVMRTRSVQELASRDPPPQQTWEFHVKTTSGKKRRWRSSRTMTPTQRQNFHARFPSSSHGLF